MFLLNPFDILLLIVLVKALVFPTLSKFRPFPSAIGPLLVWKLSPGERRQTISECEGRGREREKIVMISILFSCAPLLAHVLRFALAVRLPLLA